MTEKKRVKNNDPFLTVQEAAEYCNASTDMIYERCRTKEIEHIRLGTRSIRIRLSSLEAWWNWETQRGYRRA